MISEQKIIGSLSTIGDVCFLDLSKIERLIVIANLLLQEAENYLPDELKKDAQLLLSNGKRINYEKLKYEDNLGINLAIYSHLILSEVEKNLIDGV